MPRHCGPMNIGVHWFAKPNGVTCKQQKPTEGLDLVKLLFAIVSSNFNPVFLYQQRDKVSTVSAAVALNTAYFVEKDERMRVYGLRTHVNA